VLSIATIVMSQERLAASIDAHSLTAPTRASWSGSQFNGSGVLGNGQDGVIHRSRSAGSRDQQDTPPTATTTTASRRRTLDATLAGTVPTRCLDPF